MLKLASRHLLENLLDSSIWSSACNPCAFEPAQSNIEIQSLTTKSGKINEEWRPCSTHGHTTPSSHYNKKIVFFFK